MASKARVRVEARPLPYNATAHERDHAFHMMRLAFKKQCEKYGINKIYKEHQYFESEPDKRRRKQKESLRNQLKEDMLMQRGQSNRGNGGKKKG